jgi:hypothetical protein
VAYGKRVRFYRLTQAANPPATKFVDAIDVVFDNTIPYDLRFFESLDRFVQREPWLERDKAMIDQLKSIGIEKGKPFNPDSKTQEILKEAAREAQTWLDVKYEGVFSPPFNEGTHWALPASAEVVEAMQTLFAKHDAYPVDGRGVSYSMAYFSAKHLGEGQFYLMSIVDKDCPSTAAALIASPCHRTRLSDCTGPRRSMTGQPTLSSGTCRGLAARLTPQECKRMLTVQWTFTSRPKLRSARIRTGSRRAPLGSSKFSSGSTGRRSHYSRKHGRSRTSRRRANAMAQ